MERNVGTVSRGIRCPIIREGDNIGQISNIIKDFYHSDAFFGICLSSTRREGHN